MGESINWISQLHTQRDVNWFANYFCIHSDCNHNYYVHGDLRPLSVSEIMEKRKCDRQTVDYIDWYI